MIGAKPTRMKHLLSAFLITVATVHLPAEAFAAQSIALERVKNYELRPEPAIKVEQVNFSPVIGRYQSAPGRLLTLSNPFESAAVNYQVADGQHVSQGDVIATLYGPSVEHFFHRLETLQEQYEVATRQYQNKKSLYQNSAIAADEWQTFLKEYLNLSDAMHEMRVIQERIRQMSEQSAELIAKEPGTWRISNHSATLGSLLMASRLALVAEVPVSQAPYITQLAVAGHYLNVRTREQTTRNGFVRIWSEAPKNVDWIVGQTFNVVPSATVNNAYRVPASSIATLANNTVVFVIESNAIVAVPVELLSLSGDQYFVKAAESLNTLVTHSVSALKVLADAEEAQP